MNFKPIAFFDIETTGTNISKDKIIDISISKIWNFNSGSERVETLTYLVNPEFPILNADIHGITDEMVKDAPTFKQIAHLISAFIEDCDLSGYNIKRFDIPLLAEELNRAGISISMKGRRIIDPFILYKILHPQTLGAAYKKYTGNDMEDAHRAEIDTKASIMVLRAMIKKKDVPENPDEIIRFQQKGEEFDSMVDLAGKFVRNKEGVILLNFGTHRNEPALDHLDFVDWMTKKEFTNDTLRWCQELLDTGGYNRNEFDWN